ncbi:hypothetical protein ABE28_017125 [Peribacillus muralis]|uniref:Uncharacterized protein n=1 Tax=Peribacillus muralis TaxID=264697 RepID=A0A1B3XS98_9BACI|nr:hypothetical protein ABE28_017125 [Peribacillus muralis]
MFLNVTEAIKNSSFFFYMYKHNHICFTGILQLIELGKAKLTGAIKSAINIMAIFLQKENSAYAESQLEI